LPNRQLVVACRTRYNDGCFGSETTRATRTPMSQKLAQRMIALRRNHPSWLLLASRNGPVTASCLKTLMEAHPGGVDFEDATEILAETFAEFSHDPEFEFDDDHALDARRELRKWMKLGLIVERDGQILATDALQRTFQFLESLEDRAMTSTASRLATVQRAIESLEAQLTSNQDRREKSLVEKIRLLEAELEAVRAGDFEPLSGAKAEEGIREVYQLATSLRADFRRVEDSYREADRTLRQRIIGHQQNRGEIVDKLLDVHDHLLKTAEGQVFDSFYQQLVKSAELEQMKQRLRSILDNKASDQALKRKQKTDLRLLVSRLNQETERVIQARARSERDVRSFLKSGLADEQVRVGAILQDIFAAAMNVDWNSQKVRRSPSPLPPIAVSCPNLPLTERFLVKQVGSDASEDLDFTVDEADPENMDDEFWHSWQALDRAELFESTMAQLKNSNRPLTIGELAAALPPTHDLETLAFWLAMAREAGIEIDGQRETIVLTDVEHDWQFDTPLVHLEQTTTENLEAGNLG
jgi:hypothetical protein